MPRPVCVPRQREMTLQKPVTVQLNAKTLGNKAYQQWMGDLAECEGCGAKVFARFGQGPFWSHFMTVAAFPADVVVEER